MQEEDLIITFLIITGLLILLTVTISIPLLLYSKKRQADQLLIRDLEDKYERELLKSQLEVQEQTLEHIGREIHDNIGSSISIAKAYLSSEAPEGERIHNTVEILKNVLSDVRDLSKNLSLESIRAYGLTKAIDGLLNQLKKLNQYEVLYDTYGHYNLMDEKVEIILFRILQESINNIIRHADATKIRITMESTASNLCFVIEDNGCGIDASQPIKPGGLSNMRTRAILIDACLSIESPNHGGTKIKLCIPIKPNMGK